MFKKLFASSSALATVPAGTHQCQSVPIVASSDLAKAENTELNQISVFKKLFAVLPALATVPAGTENTELIWISAVKKPLFTNLCQAGSPAL